MDVIDNEKEEESGKEQEAVEEVKTDREKEIERLGGRANLIKTFGSVEIKLVKPFTFCGKTYDALTMDFEGLTGKDMEDIDDELSIMRKTVQEPRTSRLYQRMLAAKAAGVGSDLILSLPLADYNAVVGAARNFLIVTG